MARSLDQIATDLAKLDASTQDLDQALQTVYQSYLGIIGQAVKRQLILAAYHLCTQAYPEEFIALTVAQREQLQTGLRQLAAQGQDQIAQLGQVSNLADLAAQLEEAVVAKYGAFASNTDDDDDDDPQTASPDESSPLADLPPPAETSTVESADSSSMVSEPAAAQAASTPGSSAAAAEQSDFDAASEEAAVMLQRLSTSLSLFSILEAEPLTPISLAKRHVLLERHLRAILRTLSSLANHLLKQANVLPDLPDMVIAAATEADGDSPGPSQPNLVSVLVEMADRRDDLQDDDDEVLDDDDAFESDEEPEHEMTHLVAINLRLADVEFADAQAALWRGRLQETLYKLKRLGRRYRTLRQEQARAEAEHAWRAIWFDD
ncbi:hypothetical protein [Halomicronema sp. CCY15110]|uniref:hypothetical protein n=1 Tax=Halomicronema sp. CCY15110 TaxID=2767773 RepID=UPI001952543F|nr:hypothetical protein [Halomicronema sp. CCY15110]